MHWAQDTFVNKPNGKCLGAESNRKHITGRMWLSVGSVMQCTHAARDGEGGVRNQIINMLEAVLCSTEFEVFNCDALGRRRFA
eukprot:5259469-Heterocapsa_arctica.AAC.1